ncbi:MAG: helix-turn-helix domain-containing protein [Pseudobacteriovorax sp.]|nr:helix-turn-helix domain-containing protein [Pseudobacteriovorax sp.]
MEKLWIENFRKNVKRLRAEKKLSQQKLAELSKLSISTITSIEQGSITNLTLQTVSAIGQGLSVKDPLKLLK